MNDTAPSAVATEAAASVAPVAEPSQSPSPTPSETLPASEARVDGVYSASQMVLPIKASCKEGPCGGMIKMAREGLVPLKFTGGVYRAETQEKRGIPGPSAYIETTVTLIIKPIKAEWVDGEWVANTLLVKRTIGSFIPSTDLGGATLKATKSARKDTMRAFLQPANASASPTPSGATPSETGATTASPTPGQ